MKIFGKNRGEEPQESEHRFSSLLDSMTEFNKAAVEAEKRADERAEALRRHEVPMSSVRDRR